MKKHRQNIALVRFLATHLGNSYSIAFTILGLELAGKLKFSHNAKTCVLSRFVSRFVFCRYFIASPFPNVLAQFCNKNGDCIKGLAKIT